MLHRSKSLRADVSHPCFYLSIAAVAAAALCAAGLRESAAGDDRKYRGALRDPSGRMRRSRAIRRAIG